jgi:hypothetical protein
MTIKYALKRAEVARFFLQSLSESPRILVIVALFSIWPGFVYLSSKGAFMRALTPKDGLVALAWTCGIFCFIVLWIFLRAKTGERTLTISEHGIVTEIGKLNGDIPWAKVRTVKDAGAYILVSRSNGNAFFIPNRSFTDLEHKREFLAEIGRYQKSK